MLDDENYVEPTGDVMDAGGIVEPAPKRTRAPRTPKAVKNEAAGLVQPDASYFLLIDKQGKVITHTADPVEVRRAAAQVVLDPEQLTLYRAEMVVPDSVFQK